MNTFYTLMSAVRRYANFRERIGGVYVDPALRKRKIQERQRVERAVALALHREFNRAQSRKSERSES